MQQSNIRPSAIPEEEQSKLHSEVPVEPQSTLISVTSLNADFTGLLVNVCHILNNSPDCQDKLEICKDYCSLLKVSKSHSKNLLFTGEIKGCSNFKQLYETIGLHMSWDEHSILTEIVNKCKSVEGQQEIEKFKKKLALFQGLQIISCTSKQNLPKDFAKFIVIINKPYKNVTIEEYTDIKTYIFSKLDTYAYVTVGFMRLLYHPLHIEWLVSVQTVPHMIKSAYRNKDIFIKENFVFMQIGVEIVIEDKVTLTQLLSRKQILGLKEYLIQQKMQITESDGMASSEKPLMMKHMESPWIRSSASVDEQMHEMECFKPFTVADKFSLVIKQVTRLLQSHDPKLLVERCEAMMASDHVHGIKFFSNDQVNQLKEYSNTPLVLQELSHLWSWSNHSILRFLVRFSDEAIKLLDEFDSRLDPFEPITSYPVYEILPTDSSAYTVLSMKFTKGILLLQDVFDMGSLVVNQCRVTHYCLQLVATQPDHSFSRVYWSIPKCVVNLISSKVLQHSSKFYDMGVLEVTIYPDAKIVTDKFINPKDQIQELSKQLQHVCRQNESVLNENKQLKQNESNLLTGLQTWKQRYKELEERCNKMQEDVEGKTKQRMASQQSKFREIKVALDEVIATFNKDAEKLIVQLQRHANEVKRSVDKSIQQQKQYKEDIDDLTTRLSIKEKEIAKLKEDNRLLLKWSESNESNQSEVKVDKDHYPVQYELLGSGNYGKVYKVQYKDKSFAGKVFHNELLPGYPNVPMNKLAGQFAQTCHLASKFSHPNVEWLVEIAHANSEGVPMIITELLNENLTSYVSHTHETLHYDLQLSVCNDMAQGLQYLHSQQLVHGNLHGANVLVTYEHHAKIADFLCPLLLTVIPPESSSVYLPPETLQDKRITVQSNVFTLAVLFLQVVSKNFPQPNNDLTISELKRRHVDLQKVPKCHPLLEHIQQCLNKDEVARLLIKDVCGYLAKLLKGKDSPQIMAFKLIHTTEYPSLLPALTSGRYQLKHIECQNLPVPMYWAYAVIIGMMVYVTGGNSRNGDAVEHIYKYDLENNRWDRLPPSKYHHRVPVVLEGKLSLIGGRKPSNKAVVGNVNTYDEESEQWVTIYPDMYQPRYRPAVVINNSHVIVLGGKIKERSKMTDTIEIMNIKDKQWTTLATLLPTKMYDVSATISNGLVWIIGYDNGSHQSKDVFTVPMKDLIYLTDEKHPWKKLYSDTLCFKTAVVSYSDPPVILGGDDRQNKTVSAVVTFDAKTESWSEVAALSSPRAFCAVVKLPGERGILVIGGCTETNSLSQCNSSCLKTTEIYYVSNEI